MYFDPDVVRDILKEMVSFYDANGTLVGLNLESVLKGMTPKKMEQYFRLLEDYGFYTGGFDYFGLRDSALRGISTVAREFLEWSENEEIWNRAKVAIKATKGASFKMFLRLLENQIKDASYNIYWDLTEKENGGDYTVTKSEKDTKDIRSRLLASLRGAFKKWCHPNKKDPYLHIAVRDGSDQIMTVLDTTTGTLFQDAPNVTYFGTVNLGELKPGDADRFLAAYEDVINRYVDDLEAGETLDRPEGTEYRSNFNVYVVIDILRYLRERRDSSDTTIVTEDIVFNPDFAEKWGVDSVGENLKQAVDAGLIQYLRNSVDGSCSVIIDETPLSITDDGIDFLNFAENGFLWDQVRNEAAKVSELSILLSKVAVVKEKAEVYGKEGDE